MKKIISAIKTKASALVERTPAVLKKHWFVFFVIVTYLLMTASYMGPGFTNCTDSIYGFGDSTAGPIWRNSLEPDQPLLGGYQTLTNYPSGESLYSPIKYATMAQTIMLDVSSDVVGPVCAYNLFNIFGYITTALVMFGFILYLTKSRWIALLSGYAVAFTPYVQSKIGGHPSYGFAALLIGVFWLLLHIISGRGRVIHGIGLAVLLAICAYFDPYFILLAITIAGPLLILWVAQILWRLWKKRIDKKDLLRTVKIFTIALGVFLVLMAPLLYVRVKNSAEINSTVGAARGNVTAAAMQCSNTPVDYLLPDPQNIHIVDILGSGYTTANINHRNWCGYGESRVSLSLIMIAIVGLGMIIIAWENLQRRRLRMSSYMGYGPIMVVAGAGLVAVAAFGLGLPPYIGDVITPSGVVLKFTETWRIFAREYLVLNIALVILFAVTLKFFSAAAFLKRRKWVPALIFVIIFVGISAEYQINTPFQPFIFSYSKDVPTIYNQVRDNKDINAIAEYPIDRLGVEYDSVIYYQTMQAVHKKSIFNSALVDDGVDSIHVALRDLSDPQTIPALRKLGIKYVVIHGMTEKEIMSKTDQLKIIGKSSSKVFSLNIIRPSGTNDSVLAKIVDGPTLDDIVVLNKGSVINLDLAKKAMNVEYETVQDAQLKLTPLGHAANDKLKNVCFQAKMSAPSDVADLTVRVNGVDQAVARVDGVYRTIEVVAKDNDVIELHNSKGYNVRLNNLGCRN